MKNVFFKILGNGLDQVKQIFRPKPPVSPQPTKISFFFALPTQQFNALYFRNLVIKENKRNGSSVG